jgi:DNA ligase-1
VHATGTRFAVGSGLTDAEGSNPPPVGSSITFRYQELTDGGVPRFPSYVGIRSTPPMTASILTHPKGASPMPQTTATRRFTYIEGTSDKFWEIGTSGTEVTVRYGRNGTTGQSNTKSFADAAAAQKHADKLIQAGIHRTYLSDVERGARNLCLVNIERLAAALGLPMSQLFLFVEKA